MDILCKVTDANLLISGGNDDNYYSDEHASSLAQVLKKTPTIISETSNVNRNAIRKAF